MRRHALPLLLTCGILAAQLSAQLSGQLSAQDFQILRTDGSLAQVKVLGLNAGVLELQDGKGKTSQCPLLQVLSLSRQAAKVQAECAVRLVGGDELKGKLTGGDTAGEQFWLQSKVLGKLQVPVDRLLAMIFRQQAEVVQWQDVQLAHGGQLDEALFLPAERGLDVLQGALERFTAEGVLFSLGREGSPRLYNYKRLAGVALNQGTSHSKSRSCTLLTTGGDLCQVDLLQVEGESLHLESEFGRLQLPMTQVAALGFNHAGLHWLSAMQPVRIEEDRGETPFGSAPIFPFRRDRSASGGFVLEKRCETDGFLTVQGHSYVRGLGVHSRSILTYRVPKGCQHFLAMVGVDDEVLAMPIQASLDVSVKSGGKVLFSAKGLSPGQAPRCTGLLAVKPEGLLTLSVDFGAGGFVGDRADWLYPVFLP